MVPEYHAALKGPVHLPSGREGLPQLLQVLLWLLQGLIQDWEEGMAERDTNRVGKLSRVQYEQSNLSALKVEVLVR